jgi:hypothetical protein
MNFTCKLLLGLKGIKQAAGLTTLSQAQRHALNIVEEVAK